MTLGDCCKAGFPAGCAAVLDLAACAGCATEACCLNLLPLTMLAELSTTGQMVQYVTSAFALRRRLVLPTKCCWLQTPTSQPGISSNFNPVHSQPDLRLSLVSEPIRNRCL